MSGNCGNPIVVAVRTWATALAIVAACCAGCRPGQGVKSKEGVVTFAPNITETVFALGQGHRVIGVSSFCTYPPEALALPKVGGHMNPDLEKLAALSPELIILQGEHQKVAAFARMNGIKTLHVHMDSVATIDEGIAIIGDALGCEAEAAALRERIDGELGAIREAVEGLGRPKALIITTRVSHDLNTLFTVGGASFISELTAIAGGRNIYEDAPQAYLEASKETVVMKAPNVIIEFHAGEDLSESERKRYIADWEQLPSLPAVQNGRVHVLTEGYGLLPGPRITETARRLAEVLHPEVSWPQP